MLPKSRLALLALVAAAAPVAAKEKVFVGENFFLWDVYGYPDTQSWENAYYNCFNAVSAADVDGTIWSLDGDGRYSFVHLRTHNLQVLQPLPGDEADGVDVAAHGGDALVAYSDGTIVRIDGVKKTFEGALHVGASVSAMTTSGDLVAVGSPDGTLRLGNAQTGDFVEVAKLGGAISSLHELGGVLYAGTPTGTIARIELATKQPLAPFTVANDAQTIAEYQGLLLVGGTDKTIERIAPATGELVDTLLRDFPVLALASFDDPTWIDHHVVTHSSSLATGVDHDLAISTGPELVGDYYMVVGSFTYAWTEDFQVVLDGVEIPLQPDAYTLFTLSSGVSSVISNARGIIPAGGMAAAKFHTAPGQVTQWFSAFHSIVTLDLATGTVSGSSTWRQVWGV
ncbi:MAG: hypothetical protein EPO68_03540 [Planctomycetota bacterium]|nr:MAG: hypothetical protein EPO68_03540 [Planctomycetota bacterium]